MFYALRYYWRSARGYRLRPWASPYIRWRFETFFGVAASDLTASEFFRLSWRHRARFREFLLWAEEIESSGAAGPRAGGVRWPG